MKNKKISLSIIASAVFLSFVNIAAGAAHAQTLQIDTLAVRIILDENGLINLPVSFVAETDPVSSRIVSLDLSGKNITTIAPQISALTSLETLILANGLLDSLPNEIWSLPNLGVLDISNNKVNKINPLVSNAKNLVYLNLGGNGLKTVPNELFSLIQLEVLVLSKNSFDSLPSEIFNLAFLKQLDLSNNLLTRLTENIGLLNQLDTLDLRGNLLTGLPVNIVSLTKTKVFLGDNQLCNLSAAQQTWANSVDVAWQSTQSCGIAVRPGALRKLRYPNSALYESGKIYVDLIEMGLGNSTGTKSVTLRNSLGRQIWTGRTNDSKIRIEAQRLFATPSKYWIEIRGKGKVLGIMPVTVAR